MKAQNPHAHEDRLLDFAYGELPQPEARVVEAHVQGCVRCTRALEDIRGVRATMSHLSAEPVPDAGLESLLAYAHQAARRAAAGPESKPSRWRRWLLPVVGLATVSTFGILTLAVSERVDLSPSLKAEKTQEAPLQFPAPASPPAGVAAAAVAAPASAPAPAEAAPEGFDEKSKADANVASGDLSLERAKRRETMQSMRKEAMRADGWMNAGSGGGFPEPRIERPSAPKKKLEAYSSRSYGAASEEPEEKVAKVAKSELPPPPPKDAAAGTTRDEEALALADADAPEAQSAGPAKEGASLRLGGSLSQRGNAEDDRAVLGATTPSVASARPSSAAQPPAASMAGAPAAAAPAAMEREVALEESVPDSDEAPRQATGRSVARAQAQKPAPVTQAPGNAPASGKGSTSVSAQELSRQAQEAARSGDRALEARLLRSALATGVSGSERLALLTRLCEAEFANGQRAEAEAACNRVLDEDPDSSAAQVARRRLRQESVGTGSTPARAAPAAPASVDPAR